MKTKIIYISGNEVFDIADIRSAFEEVRNALNLDKTTVLFGVPVDADDAGFATQTTQNEPITNDQEIITEPEIIEEQTPENESVIEQPTKKRGRPRKEIHEEIIEEIPQETNTETPENTEKTDEAVVPILSVLSNDDDEIIDNELDNNIEIIAEVSPQIPTEDQEVSVEITTAQITETPDESEADLEKLLSAMTPLEEDTTGEQPTGDIAKEDEDASVDISVDETLEKLATEFIENQDKIAEESKSSSRSKIGKLRSILPFKQSKHKDQGLGDLFGWAGAAANDEDFSVPGFFTNAAGKK